MGAGQLYNDLVYPTDVNNIPINNINNINIYIIYIY
jgi:hypothetical protein